MLIDLKNLPITTKVRGILHVGAHECEERLIYLNTYGLDDSKVIWIDAILEKVNLMKSKFNSLQIYNECVSNVDNEEVEFIITNNYQSSSLLELKTHKIRHPSIIETNRIKMKTKKLKTFILENNIDINNYNFLNLDLQGSELLALKGLEELLEKIDYIYTEVNTEELYKNCALITDIDEYLKFYGFERIITHITGYGWGDAFYVKNK